MLLSVIIEVRFQGFVGLILICKYEVFSPCKLGAVAYVTPLLMLINKEMTDEQCVSLILNDSQKNWGGLWSLRQNMAPACA